MTIHRLGGTRPSIGDSIAYAHYQPIPSLESVAFQSRYGLMLRSQFRQPAVMPAKAGIQLLQRRLRRRVLFLGHWYLSLGTLNRKATYA